MPARHCKHIIIILSVCKINSEQDEVSLCFPSGNVPVLTLDGQPIH